MRKLNQGVGILLACATLVGCLGSSEPEEFQLTAYVDRPLSVDQKKEKLNPLYKRFLTPFGDKTACDGKQFLPRVRIGRGDLDSAPIFESGKLAASAAGGADSFFGVPADAAKLRENAALELEKWDYKPELYSPASGQPTDILKLIKRDLPNAVIVVSDNANARRDTLDNIKSDLGREAPLVVGFSENPGDEFNRKMIELLCAQPKKEGKPTSVAMYFLGDSLPAPKPVIIAPPNVEPPPAPVVSSEPKPARPRQPVVVAPQVPVLIQPPVVIQQPPVVAPAPAPAPPQVIQVEAPPANAKEACFQERKHRTDTTSVGDNLCVTRKCSNDARYRGTPFCTAWLNQNQNNNSTQGSQ